MKNCSFFFLQPLIFNLRKFGSQIQDFDLFPGPRCLAQELEARFDTRVLIKAVDGDHAAQFFPAIVI